MNILYVCTANICRSPSAEFLMRGAVEALQVRDVQVSSAGVRAVPGLPACPRGFAPPAAHRSRVVTPGAVRWADLILTAARDHLGAISDIDRRARPRVYTIRQAGRLSRWMLSAGLPEAGRARATRPLEWSQKYGPDDPRRDVVPLSQEWDRWLLEELNAARGFAPVPVEPSPDDIGDPHDGDPSLHPLNRQQLWESTNDLACLMQAVQRACAGLSRA